MKTSIATALGSTLPTFFFAVQSLFLMPVACADNQVNPGPPAPGTTVISPDKFSYPMKMGYSAAQKYPEVMKKLFCYCGCDKTDKHTSLLDCYLTTHGAYCEICLEEAIRAKDLSDKKADIKTVQKEIDKGFAKLYPLKDPSPALLLYRENLKKSGIVPTLSKLGSEKNKTTKTTKTPGECCGDHTEKKKKK